MDLAIEELRSLARLLQQGAAAQEESAMARLGLGRVRSSGRNHPAHKVQHRHCLAVVASELGFNGWKHASSVLRGKEQRDFGTLLYPTQSGRVKTWYSNYEEASRVRKQTQGFLLAYKDQYFVVGRFFIQSMGVDPNHEDWTLIGRDWVRPRDFEARGRLYSQLARARMRHLSQTRPA